MNICNIRRAFEQKAERGWDTLYVMIDVHGVIIPNSYQLHVNRQEFISPNCEEVLQWFSTRKDIKIILWTSSFSIETAHLIEWLAVKGINIDYVNRNPECVNTKYADFTHKPYFNILIDDKAGFEPETDWRAIKTTLIEIGEWDKKE